MVAIDLAGSGARRMPIAPAAWKPVFPRFRSGFRRTDIRGGHPVSYRFVATKTSSFRLDL
jgi:hypothetical protein